MKKRITALLLALVMVLGLTAAVFAEGGISIMSIQPEAPTHTYIFQAGGVEIGRQIIKHNESLKDPGVPSAPAGKRFVRWNPAVSFDTPLSVTVAKTFEVHAVFETVYTVYFQHDGRTVATRELTDTQPSVSTDDVLISVGDHQKLAGWYFDDKRYTTVITEDFRPGVYELTLTARVEDGRWIYFNSAGGSYVAPQLVIDTTQQPPAPVRHGYTFQGWYLDEDKFQFGGELTEDITLTAKWENNANTSYKVIHWQEKADEDGWSLYETESKTGRTGAQTEAAQKSYPGFNARTIVQQTIQGDGSTIVNVYYDRIPYYVKFFTMDGRREYTQYQIHAKYGANIRDKWPKHNNSSAWAVYPNAEGNKYQSNIDTMPLGGKSFYGPQTGLGSETAYYYTEVLPGETGTEPYKGKQYKLDHSDTTPGTGYSITEDDKYPITGFTFFEFAADWNGGLSHSGYSYKDAKFYYTRNSYDVVCISGGVTEKTQSMKYQQPLDNISHTPAPPLGKEEYTFVGWYDNELCTGSEYVLAGRTMPAHNLTLYAKWVERTYEVTVYDVDRSSLLKTFRDVPMGGSIHEDEMPENEVTLGEDDVFLGWMDMRNDMPFHFDTKIHRDYMLYAKTDNTEKLMVEYSIGGGSGSAPVDHTWYAKGAHAVVLPPAGVTPPPGKVFLFWSAEGDSTRYYPGGKLTMTGNMMLTAVYGPRTEAVRVTYHSNFAPDETRTSNEMLNNSVLHLPEYSLLGLPPNLGYRFDGWNTQADGRGLLYKSGVPVLVDNALNPSNDLYAMWMLDDAQIVFVTNGGTPVRDMSGKTGETITNREMPATTRSGYTLEGWYAAADFSGEEVKLLPDAFPAGTTTYYAKWLKTTLDTVVFDPNNIRGKPLASKSLTVYSGSAPRETFKVVVKEPAGTQRSFGTVRLSGGSQSASFTGFEPIMLQAAGSYSFTVGELSRGTRYMSYDTNLYTLTVTVEEKEGMLVISDVYYTNAAGRSYRDFPIVFSNTYGSYMPYVPAVPPKTPDKLNADDHFAYVIGYPDGGAHPNATITRAETATIFFRLLTEKTRKESLTKYHSFRDVPQGAWYNAAVATMAKLRIITGYPDGTFQPDAPVTRAEFAAIAARFDEKLDRTTASFRDIYGHWAELYISRSVELGWIRGYTDNTFRPDQSITRAEAMALINRVLNRNPESKDDLLRSMNIFNDNLDTAKWYYLDVQEAANSHDYIRKANGYEMWKKLLPDPDWKALER